MQLVCSASTCVVSVNGKYPSISFAKVSTEIELTVLSRNNKMDVLVGKSASTPTTYLFTSNAYRNCYPVDILRFFSPNAPEIIPVKIIP